jgi:CubicO group peptidase (beta-lactamase class C family)
MTPLAHAEMILERARAARAFSAVTAEIGRTSGPLWTYAGGSLGFDSPTAPVDASTIFDLASLTKVLATTTIAVGLAARDVLDVDAFVHAVLPAWTAHDRAMVTVRDLLEHCSGLPGYREYFRHLTGRHAYAVAIAAEPLEYTPRAQSVYSDLGFIILGFALERLGGAPLDEQFNRWRAGAAIDAPLAYTASPAWKPRTALTEHDPWRGRILQGEVHDENAAALGGVAAHAGLFGTAAAVGQTARWWMSALNGCDDSSTAIPARIARRFVERSTVPGSSRALGWDTMLPTSSCGTRMSARAIGHTGFTGTSLWIDPEQDLYFVLLTNRVHPTRANDTIQQVRRDFHDAALADLHTGM